MCTSQLKEYADPSCVDEAIQLLNHAMCLDRPMNVKRLGKSITKNS